MSLDLVLEKLEQPQQMPQGFVERFRYNFKKRDELAKAQDAKLTEEQARDTQKLFLTNGLMFAGLTATFSYASNGLFAGLMAVNTSLSFYQVGRLSSNILYGVHRKATHEELIKHYKKRRLMNAGMSASMLALSFGLAGMIQYFNGIFEQHQMPWDKYVPQLLLFSSISAIYFYSAYRAHSKLNKLRNVGESHTKL